jgi:predicted metalloprotease with PDZ domain
MQRSTVIGSAVSIGLHLTLVAVLVHAVLERAEQPPPPAAVEIVELPQTTRNGRLDESEGDSRSCAPGRWFAGIGMEMNERHVVILVPRAYPAFQAGLRLGDVVVNPRLEPDSAGYDAVDFRRKGRLHRLIIKTRQICRR